MEFDFIESLACPYHPDRVLHLAVSASTEDDIVEGTLACQVCARTFPIQAGIPDLRPDELKSGEATRSTGWTPGPRKWQPKGLTRLVTAIRVPGSLLTLETPTGPPKDWHILDIGCGNKPRGTVNMDVYVPTSLPRNFVLGSAESLPFRPKSFDLVTSRFVIEHVLEPANFVRAKARCARHQVEIITDNLEWIGDRWFRIFQAGRIFHDEHCYCWTKEYLDNLVRRLGYRGHTTAYVLPTETLVTALSGVLASLPRVGVFFAPYLRTIVDVQMER